MANGACAKIAALGVAREGAAYFFPINESQPNLKAHVNPNPQHGNAWENSGDPPEKAHGSWEDKI